MSESIKTQSRSFRVPLQSSGCTIFSKFQLWSYKTLLRKVQQLFIPQTKLWQRRPFMIYPKPTLSALPPIYPFTPTIIHRITLGNSAFCFPSLVSSLVSFPFLWNVLSSCTISAHSSLKTQLKCQLIPQPDVIFIWVPTTSCTLSWHLTFSVVFQIRRGTSFQSRYR